MPEYQHDFDDVEGYLHHRAPYLMVDQVISLSATEVVTAKTLSERDFFFAGHFPGAPIVPGAMMQEMTTQSAGILIAARHNPMKEFNTSDPHFNEYALGVLVKLNHARFKGFARPGDTATIRVELNERVSDFFDFSASVSIGDATIMRNGFRLTNIKSEVLIG